MGKYFGTDGVRGEANKVLTAQQAFDIGRYIGYHYQKNGKGKVLIGKDTRLSSSMFEMALAAGVTSQGSEVYLLGYCPTPTVAYLVSHKEFDCGVMISASHNPYYDNGIKIFDYKGVKISAELESCIESYMDGKSQLEYQTNKDIGKVTNYSQGLELYIDWLENQHPLNLKGMKIVLDCANGSASTTAYQLLSRYGAELIVLNNDPDGLNINTECGSTHPEKLEAYIKENGADIGLAFDGDADRLIAINSEGAQVTGDHILYICSKAMKEKNKLNKNTVVTTVMANLGLFKALETEGINTAITAVGDKYVFEEMEKNDYVLGGEQSGHIIFKQYLPTGDGLQTALHLIAIMSETKKSLIELSQGLKIYPQLLVNVKVRDKDEAMNDEEVKKEIEAVNLELNGNGRILVRPSGTEPLVRVMVEAENDELCKTYVYRVVNLVESKFKN